MNILLINHYAGSLEYGMEYRPFYMSREWVENGHNVTVVGATFSHIRQNQPKIDKLVETEFIAGIRYVWLDTPKYKGNGVGRIINMLTFLFRLFVHTMNIVGSNKPDIVVASSTYPLDMYLAKYIADKYKAKVVYEVHDLWPLSPMELGGMSKYHPFIMVMQAAENYAYRVADKVVAFTRESKKHMIEHGLLENKFVFVPNGIAIDEWYHRSVDNIPEEHGNILSKLREDGYFIIGYTGGHAISNALEQLINAAEHLKHENIAIVLVGNGTEKARLIELAKSKGLYNVYFLPSVKKKYIPAILGKMDAVYIGWNDRRLYKIAGLSPNKILDYMMAKKCIVHSVSIPNDIVQVANCGLSVQAENDLEIANAISAVANMSNKERRLLGENGYNYVLKNHDYRVLADKFLKAME